MDFNAENITQNHEVSVGDFQVNFRFRKGDRPGLIVAFDGWDDELSYSNDASYSKFKILKSLGYSCLYFSHPRFKGQRISHTLYIGMLKAMVVKNLLFSIIQEARKALKQDVIFYGRSSGGYAALFYGMCIPRSCSLVVNPEVDIFSHESKIIARNLPIYKTFFPVGKIINLSSFSLNNKILSSKFLPNVLYIQSISDTEYLEEHAKPFVESYSARLAGCESGRLSVSYVADERGHSYDLTKNDFMVSIESLLSFKTSRVGAKTKGLTSRPLYRKTTTLPVTIQIKIFFSVETDFLTKSIRLYYAMEPQEIVDGFKSDPGGFCYMDLSTVNGVMDQNIEMVLPSGFSTLYIKSLGEAIDVKDLSLSVIDYYENA
jgi:hypothetical protein